MSVPVAKEVKKEILNKIEGGQSVKEVAEQYGISTKTVYRWLKETKNSYVSAKQYNKLKRENELLKKLLGMAVLELERKKK